MLQRKEQGAGGEKKRETHLETMARDPSEGQDPKNNKQLSTQNGGVGDPGRRKNNKKFLREGSFMSQEGKGKAQDEVRKICRGQICSGPLNTVGSN